MQIEPTEEKKEKKTDRTEINKIKYCVSENMAQKVGRGAVGENMTSEPEGLRWSS